MTKLIAVASMLVTTVAFAESVPQGKPTGAEAEVHATHASFSQYWNSHDVANLAGMWTKDGDHTEPDGRTVHGRAEVQKLFAIEHASVFKESRLNLVVERVRFIGDAAAIADGSYELFDARDPAGRPIGIRTGYFTTVLAKEDGKWLVSASRLMLPSVLIWRQDR